MLVPICQVGLTILSKIFRTCFHQSVLIPAPATIDQGLLCYQNLKSLSSRVHQIGRHRSRLIIQLSFPSSQLPNQQSQSHNPYRQGKSLLTFLVVFLERSWCFYNLLFVQTIKSIFILSQQHDGALLWAPLSTSPSK